MPSFTFVVSFVSLSAPLSVDVEPSQQVLDYGRPATFKCSYRGNPVRTVRWYKDGEDLGHGRDVLRIASVKKEDRGMYQCFVRNDRESAQATGELKLGGRFDPPEFVHTFPEETVQPGEENGMGADYFHCCCYIRHCFYCSCYTS